MEKERTSEETEKRKRPKTQKAPAILPTLATEGDKEAVTFQIDPSKLAPFSFGGFSSLQNTFSFPALPGFAPSTSSEPKKDLFSSISEEISEIPTIPAKRARNIDVSEDEGEKIPNYDTMTISEEEWELENDNFIDDDEVSWETNLDELWVEYIKGYVPLSNRSSTEIRKAFKRVQEYNSRVDVKLSLMLRKDFDSISFLKDAFEEIIRYHDSQKERNWKEARDHVVEVDSLDKIFYSKFDAPALYTFKVRESKEDSEETEGVEAEVETEKQKANDNLENDDEDDIFEEDSLVDKKTKFAGKLAPLAEAAKKRNERLKFKVSTKAQRERFINLIKKEFDKSFEEFKDELLEIDYIQDLIVIVETKAIEFDDRLKDELKKKQISSNDYKERVAFYVDILTDVSKFRHGMFDYLQGLDLAPKVITETMVRKLGVELSYADVSVIRADQSYHFLKLNQKRRSEKEASQREKIYKPKLKKKKTEDEDEDEDEDGGSESSALSDEDLNLAPIPSDEKDKKPEPKKPEPKKPESTKPQFSKPVLTPAEPVKPKRRIVPELISQGRAEDNKVQASFVDTSSPFALNREKERLFQTKSARSGSESSGDDEERRQEGKKKNKDKKKKKKDEKKESDDDDE